MAAFDHLPAGGRPLGMGSAFTAVAEGPESMLFNPAGPGQVKHISLCLFLSRPFGLKELSYETITGVLPSRFGNWGFGFQTYGHSLYRENTAIAGWAHHYLNQFYCGISLCLLQLRIEKYGSAHTLIFNAGCLLKLSKQLQWGSSFSNLFQGRIGQCREPLPQIMRTGLCYKPAEGILLSVELDKDVHYPFEIKGGAEIRPISTFSLRFGFGREPDLFSAGFGLLWKVCALDYAFTTHPVLGITHQGSVSLHYQSVLQKKFSAFP